MINSKQNRKYKLFGLFVVIGLIAALASGPEQLASVQKLTIVSPNGQPVIVLDGSAGWPVIRLNDSNGRPRMILYAGHDDIGPSIDLIYPNGMTKTVAIRGEEPAPITSRSTSNR